MKWLTVVVTVCRYQGGVYSCTCQAWKFQNKPINLRTCRHLKEFRGEDREAARISTGPAATAAAARAANGGKGAVPGVMLAQNYTVGKNVVGWWMSEKLDGVSVNLVLIGLASA